MRSRDIEAILKRVPELPDEAILPDPVSALIIGVSTRTLRRRNSPPKVQTGPRTGGRRLGDIRALGRPVLAGAAA